MSLTGRIRRAALALPLVLAPVAAFAADATIGIRTEPSSVDPHFSYVATSKAAVTNIFDTLIMRNKDLELTPSLATEWTYLGDNTWEFKLREGVTWHDGEPFTADDVLFTF
ncbi:MAG: ABC transporter substrate-binding protein, partial [Pseudomonadota bacterium]